MIDVASLSLIRSYKRSSCTTLWYLGYLKGVQLDNIHHSSYLIWWVGRHPLSSRWTFYKEPIGFRRDDALKRIPTPFLWCVCIYFIQHRSLEILIIFYSATRDLKGIERKQITSHNGTGCITQITGERHCKFIFCCCFIDVFCIVVFNFIMSIVI